MALKTYTDVLWDHPSVGRPVAELATPAPLVDVDILDANIAAMAAFFRGQPASLRPHSKTHRPPEVARRQLAAGATGVTCAKGSMAEAMVDGVDAAVYVANQAVAAQALERLCRLARRDVGRRRRCGVAGYRARQVAVGPQCSENGKRKTGNTTSRFSVFSSYDAGVANR